MKTKTWLLGLEANKKTLGFGERTARLLIAGANRKLAADLTEADAIVKSRTVRTFVGWHTPISGPTTLASGLALFLDVLPVRWLVCLKIEFP
jgi:hypothetical protein